MAADTHSPELFDPDAEANLVAIGMFDPDVWAVDVAPADFHDGELARIWEVGQAAQRRGEYAADTELLQQGLRERGFDVSLTRFAELLGRNVNYANAPVFADRVRDLAQRRTAELRLQAAARALYQSNGSWRADVALPLAELTADIARAGRRQTADPTTWADMDSLLAPVAFDWQSWLAPGFLHMLVAASGEGKSNLVLRIAATYMRGWPWPDGTPYTGETGRVLWCEAEAAQAMNVERAKAWGLPTEDILSPMSNPLDDVNLFDAEHLASITAIAHRDDVRLIVVDSLSAACGGREKAEEQMPVVLWLAALARNTGKPVMVLHHLRKRGMFDSGAGVGLDRVRGSTVIVQLARLVWAIDTPDPNSAEHKRLSVIKSNLAKYPDALGLRIDENGLTFDDAPTTPKPETQIDKAMELLLALLQYRAVPTGELEEEAKGAGISWDTMKRAKEKLGIIARRDGKAGKWYWALPMLIASKEQEAEQEADD